MSPARTGAPAPLVWYNSGLSQTYDALRLIRDYAGLSLRILASHVDALAPALGAADLALVEPGGIVGDADYLLWCLEVCSAYSVALFIPGRRARMLSAARDRFAALGTRLQVFPPAILDLCEHKDALYRDLAATGIPVPEYRVVRDLAGFDRAYADLRTRYPSLCVKPTVGIYGAGFRILSETADDWDCLVGVDPNAIPLQSYRDALGRSTRRFEIMLMPFLPGTERSVDCLAVSGRLVCAVSRVKRGRHQVLENAGPAIDRSRQLTWRYGLDGIYNCQFKDRDGVPYLLEINPRMSGGLLYACQSGVALPYWNAMLALELAVPESVPVPRDGMLVAPVQGVVPVAPPGED
jgi:hypothetical protein